MYTDAGNFGTIFLDNRENKIVLTPTANWLDCSFEFMISSSLLITDYKYKRKINDNDKEHHTRQNHLTNTNPIPKQSIMASKVTLSKKTTGFATFTIKGENHTLGNLLRMYVTVEVMCFHEADSNPKLKGNSSTNQTSVLPATRCLIR